MNNFFIVYAKCYTLIIYGSAILQIQHKVADFPTAKAVES